MKKPRIAILAMLRGGIGHYIAQLSPHLAEDYDIEYISYKFGLPGDEVTLDDPAIAKHIKNKPLFGIAYNSYNETTKSIGDVVDFLKKKKIDVLNIHVGTIVRETAYVIISIVSTAKKLGIKILYTFHDVEPFEKYAGGEDFLRTLYQLADGGTVGGEDEREKLIKKFGFNADDLIIARHGIYSIFDFNKFDRASARRHLGIPEDKKVILNFGILRDYKGFDDTISAMPKILSAHKNAFLHVSSGVRVWDNSHDLIKLAKRVGLGKNTIKLNFDFVPSSEIEPIFKASDVVVLPYKQVSQSGILNIALFFKKPVILSNLFLEADMVDRKMGLIIKPGKPDLIAQAVDKLLSDTSFYKQCEKNITAYLKKDIWKATAQNYNKIIKKILS